RRAGGPRGRPVRTRRPRGARRARSRALGHLHAAPAAVADAARAGRIRAMTAARAYGEGERATRRRARHLAVGRKVAPRRELRGYCEKLAGAVGICCVAVYGSDDVERAETLGIALQLINIIRDVAEDWQLGRVYIPQDELASSGVSEADIAAGNASPAWHALMTFQAERARAYLEDGLGLLRSLDGRSALCVSTFAGLYRATLERIEARGF